jgi:hypothetical protein
VSTPKNGCWVQFEKLELNFVLTMHKRRSSAAHIDRLLDFWICICLPVPEIQSENKKQHTNNLALPTKSEGHDNGGNESIVMLMRGHDNNKQNIQQQLHPLRRYFDFLYVLYFIVRI